MDFLRLFSNPLLVGYATTCFELNYIYTSMLGLIDLHKFSFGKENLRLEGVFKTN